MATEPVPPPAARTDAIAQLKRDLWFARDAGETNRVAEITRQIGRLRATPAGEPEDTAARPPQRETTAAKPRPATAKPRAAKARATRKTQTPRSPRVPRN